MESLEPQHQKEMSLTLPALLSYIYKYERSVDHRKLMIDDPARPIGDKLLVGLRVFLREDFVMPRAAYNTTCDIINGPGTASPGTIRHANVPCRFVSDSIIFQREKWLDQDVAYVTMDESDIGAYYEFNPIPDYTIKPKLCDRLAIPSGVAANFTVLWTEKVFPAFVAPYYRAHVVPGA